MFSFRDLVERRVPQYLAIYLGAGWGMVEFVTLLEERYAIAPVWTDVLLLSWALLIPSVVLFTYFHGRPGRDRWGRAEKVFIPLNVLVVLAAAGTAFSARADATTTVTVTDETGATIERTVARSEYRKRLAIFDFDAPATDTAVAWLAVGVPVMITADLIQDMFVDLRVSAHFQTKLEEAGIAPGSSVPRALQRRIATEFHLPYFLTGTVTRAGDAYTIRALLYETGTGQPVGDRSVTGTDLLALVDELTPLLKEDLGLPSADDSAVPDLGVSEVLSTSVPAIQAYSQAQTAVLNDDWEGAEQLMLRASQLDPTFAFAHFGHYQVRALRGDVQGALPSLQAAMDHLYRMPERIQLSTKVEHFLARQDMEKGYAVAVMMTELYPDDLQGLAVRYQLENMRNETDGAIATLQRMLEVDPNQHELLLQVGELQSSKGAFQDALGTYAAYAERFPQDHEVQVRMARSQQRLGRLKDARSSLDRALLLDPTDVEATLELASLLRNTGEFAAAWQKLEEARALARGPQARAEVAQAEETYYEFRGQYRDALRAADVRLAAAAEFQPPVMVLGQRLSLFGTLVSAGRRAEAEAQLQQLRAQMEGQQIVDFWRIGQIQLGLATRDTVALKEAAVGIRPIIDDLGLRGLETEVARANAMVHEVRGDWAGALAEYERQKMVNPGALSVQRDIARALRNLGRLDDALAAANVHLQTVPMTPLTNVEAGRILLQRGDTAGARAYLQRAARTWQAADVGYAPAPELKALLAAIGG